MEAIYKNENIIYLAGGCFWGVEGYFAQISGVIGTEVGYANGKTKETNYHSINQTDHAETLKVIYDSNTISLEEILLHYFRIIDPISIDRQGGDTGRQYRTGIYSQSQETVNRVQLSLNQLQKNYNQPIAVENELLRNYIKAEDYHQKYLDKNPTGYCHIDLGLAKEPLKQEEYHKPSDNEIRKNLSKEQYEITQKAGTELPFSHEYDKFDQDGIYVDIVTGEPLFSSRDKYDAGCGWPSFSKPIKQKSVNYAKDNSLARKRIEVVSEVGDSHLGHVFTDGPKDSGGLRYCINGSALRFVALKDMEDQGYADYIPFVN